MYLSIVIKIRISPHIKRFYPVFTKLELHSTPPMLCIKYLRHSLAHVSTAHVRHRGASASQTCDSKFILHRCRLLSTQNECTQFSSPEMSESIPSTVEKLPSAVWDVVKSEGMAAGKPFPIRVPLGLDALAVVRQKCYEQLRLCDEWEKVALSTTKDGADTTPNKYLLEKMSIMNLAK